jgi:hypothetical protein
MNNGCEEDHHLRPDVAEWPTRLHEESRGNRGSQSNRAIQKSNALPGYCRSGRAVHSKISSSSPKMNLVRKETLPNIYHEILNCKTFRKKFPAKCLSRVLQANSYHS